LTDDNLVWCLKQKRGIRIIEPNPNLTKAYLKKAISALNTMTAAARINETDWILTTAYYARYFALYALLMKIGIKSKIHDCTINLAKLLANNHILNQTSIEDLAKAKQTRIGTQYYVETQLNPRTIQRNIEASRKFVLETEKAIDNITTEQVNAIRTQLQKLKQAT
jgi:uncharacterized protein (UPF0332 family)